MRQRLRVHAAARILHRERQAARLPPCAKAHTAARPACLYSIVRQVHHQAFQQRRFSLHRTGVRLHRLQRHAPGSGFGCDGACRLFQQSGHVHRLPRRLFAPQGRHLQKALAHHGKAVCLLHDVLRSLVFFLLGQLGPLDVFSIAAHSRERCAQLMRYVVHKLLLAPGRFTQLGHVPFHTGRHLIQRMGKLAHLVPRALRAAGRVIAVRAVRRIFLAI